RHETSTVAVLTLKPAFRPSDVHAVICSLLELDQELDRLALVHRAVAGGHICKRAGAVEDTAGFDASLEDVRHQLLDVGACRGGAAADRDVVVERLVCRGDFLVLRHSDATDGAARPDDADSRLHREVVADALEGGLDAETAGQLAHALDRIVAAVAHDIGGAEVAAESDPVLVPAEQDDLLGAE